MIITTTQSIEGHRVHEYQGIVVGDGILMVSKSGTALVIVQ